MLSCGALERSNNPYTEAIVEPCVSENQKRSSLREFDWEENPEKEKRQWKRIFMSFKWNLFICVWERKKIIASKLL